MKSKRKLRNYLIDKNFQLGLTWKLLFIAAFSCVCTGLAVYLSVWPVVSSFVPHALAMKLELKIILRLVLMGIALAVFVTAFCIVISHKIFGPVHKIEKHLDELIREGHTDKITLRKGDAMESLAKKLNETVSGFKREK